MNLGRHQIPDSLTYLEDLRSALDPEEFRLAPEEIEDMRQLFKTMRVSKRLLKSQGPQAGVDLAHDSIDMLRVMQWYFMQIGSYVQDYIRTQKNIDLQEVPIGCLPTLDVNAHAIRCKDGSSLILVEPGLVGLLHSLNVMVVSLRKFWPVWPGGSPLEDFNQNEINEYVKDIIRSFIFRLESSCDVDFDPAESGDRFRRFANCYNLQSMSTAQHMFILSHEFAHFLKGHLSSNSTEYRTLPFTRGRSVEFYKRSQEQEKEADALGLELTLGCLKTYEKRIAGWNPWIRSSLRKMGMAGLHLLFIYFDVAEKVLSGRAGGPSTHPPALERYEAITRQVPLSADEVNWRLAMPVFKEIFAKIPT